MMRPKQTRRACYCWSLHTPRQSQASKDHYTHKTADSCQQQHGNWHLFLAMTVPSSITVRRQGTSRHKRYKQNWRHAKHVDWTVVHDVQLQPKTRNTTSKTCSSQQTTSFAATWKYKTQLICECSAVLVFSTQSTLTAAQTIAALLQRTQLMTADQYRHCHMHGLSRQPNQLVGQCLDRPCIIVRS